MERAYGLKDLGQLIVDEAKANGLEIAEEALEQLGKAVYYGFSEWLSQSASLSDNKIDDILAPFYKHVDQYVLPQIDKIDLDKDGD